MMKTFTARFFSWFPLQIRRLNAGLFVCMVGFWPLASAQQVSPVSVQMQADWRVRLVADGKGTDSRSAQLLVLLGGLGGADGVATAQDKVSWPASASGAYQIDSTLTPRGALAVLLRRLHWCAWRVVRCGMAAPPCSRPAINRATARPP